MKTFLLFALAVVVCAMDVCKEDRANHLAEGTCGNSSKVPVCMDANTYDNYLGSKSVRLELRIQNIVKSEFVTKIEYKCPYNDTSSFHESVYSHQSAEHTHIFRTSSGTQVVVTHNHTIISNKNNGATCESRQEGMYTTPGLYGIFDI